MVGEAVWCGGRGSGRGRVRGRTENGRTGRGEDPRGSEGQRVEVKGWKAGRNRLD